MGLLSAATTNAREAYVVLTVLHAAASGLVVVVAGLVRRWLRIRRRRRRATTPQWGLRGPPGADAFSIKNGYSWDLALVVPIPSSTAPLTPAARAFPLRRILTTLAKEGVETRAALLSAEAVIVKLRAAEERLAHEARGTGGPGSTAYRLECDAARLRRRATQQDDHTTATTTDAASSHGHKSFLPWAPLTALRRDARFSPLDPFEACYAPYHEALRALYRRRPLEDGVFRGVDRMRLLRRIVDRKVPTRRLLAAGAVLRLFGINDARELSAVERAWGSSFVGGRAPPLDAIRDYFGEALAFREALRATAARWTLCLPGCASAAVAVLLIARKRGDLAAAADLAYGVVVLGWVVGFAAAWRRKRADLALRWGCCSTLGTSATADNAADDPPSTANNDKRGEWIASPITGRPRSYLLRPDSRRFGAFARLVALVATTLAAIVGVVAAEFALKDLVYAPRRKVERDVLFALIDAARVACGAGVLAPVAAVAVRLDSRHRNASRLRKNDVYALTALKAANAYASLTYVAFARPFLQGGITDRDASRELRILLAVTMLVRAPFWLVGEMRRPHDAAEHGRRGYSPTVEVLGYVALFSVAFPPATLVAAAVVVAGGVLEPAAVLVFSSRRRVDEDADDGVGEAWARVVETWLPAAAIASTSALLALSPGGRVFDRLLPLIRNSNTARTKTTARLVVFLVLEHVFFAVWFLVRRRVAITSDAIVELQRQRHEFILSKVLDNVSDRDDGGVAPPSSSGGPPSSSAPGEEDDDDGGLLLRMADPDTTESQLHCGPLPVPDLTVQANDTDWEELRFNVV